MNEHDIESALIDLEYQTGEDGEPVIQGLLQAVSFEDAGILTNNRGVVLRMKDGSEFQITIVQSAAPDPNLNDQSDEPEGAK